MAQLVARYLGVVEAASSSLVTQTSLSGQHFGACPLLFCKFTPGERIKSLAAATLLFYFFAQKFTNKVKFEKLRGCFGEVTALDFYPHF